METRACLTCELTEKLLSDLISRQHLASIIVDIGQVSVEPNQRFYAASRGPVFVGYIGGNAFFSAIRSTRPRLSPCRTRRASELCTLPLHLP